MSDLEDIPLPPSDDRRVASTGGVVIEPDEVIPRLSEHVLVDGFPIVLDLQKSHGSWLVDQRTGEEYLDFYTFFASAPLGFNPPGIVRDEEFLRRLGAVAVHKPANGDMYTTHYAEFVSTFVRVLGDPELPHLFFVEGGALAVENALKVAFDWKSLHNAERGRPAAGGRVLHLAKAFHGRSGFTLSLTNTDPSKTERFPTFDWPRIDVPAMRFPVTAHRAEIEQAERSALDQAEQAFRRHPHDIACFLAEPIQSEGGDNHLRPEFLRAMQRMCERHDALFVLDEVQTGCGITGTPWAYQQLDIQPDVVAFGKKIQLGGVMAGRRVNEVARNVFRVGDRLSSTWGGGLTDMVRGARLLDIIEQDDLIAAAARKGAVLLRLLTDMAARYPTVVSNVRGRGLMCAFDLPSRAMRDEVLRNLREGEHVLLLSCGERAVRARPQLNVSETELATAVDAVDRVLTRLGAATTGQA